MTELKISMSKETILNVLSEMLHDIKNGKIISEKDDPQKDIHRMVSLMTCIKLVKHYYKGE